MSKTAAVALSSTTTVSRLVRELIRSLGRVQTSILLKAINNGADVQEVQAMYPLDSHHINLLRNLEVTPQKYAQ